MPLPPKTYELVRRQFEALLTEADQVLQKMEQKDIAARKFADRLQNWIAVPPPYVDESFYTFRTNFLLLTGQIASGNDDLRRIADQAATLESNTSDMKKLRGFMPTTMCRN